MAAQRLERSPRAFTRTAVCVVCDAVYAPSPLYEYLLQAPSVALESAFMSMCRFCFRCRRPACPGCWDDVHAVCGACSSEAGLPFRSYSPPLNGSLPQAPSRQPPPAQTESTAAPLFCVQSGRFHEPAPHAVVRATPGTRKSNALAMIDEVPTQVPGARKLTKVAHPVSPFDIDAVETRPESPKRVIVWGEQVLTFLTFIVVLTITLLILLAVLSDKANAMIASTLHVDIRADIEALWRLIGHH
ncbi:MAG TPA: hypothetical protein VFB60_01650 [Ktedonobacteraceae bacterium]|nr:hypothetical protein [Ktedonobacteraceae bacterium]